jgi:hypothetical protein
MHTEHTRTYAPHTLMRTQAAATRTWWCGAT